MTTYSSATIQPSFPLFNFTTTSFNHLHSITFLFPQEQQQSSGGQLAITIQSCTPPPPPFIVILLHGFVISAMDRIIWLCGPLLLYLIPIKLLAAFTPRSIFRSHKYILFLRVGRAAGPLAFGSGFKRPFVYYELRIRTTTN